MVGKRKRDTSVISRTSTTADAEDTQAQTQTQTQAQSTARDASSHDIFRKFFESQFQPLDLPANRVSHNDDGEDDTGSDGDDGEDSESGSEWSGVSNGGGEDEDNNNQVEVVECKDSRSTTTKDDIVDKKARKAFMNSKPPSSFVDLETVKKNIRREEPKEEKEEDKHTDAENLKNDLALQRLLKESHLLDSGSDLAPSGKNRHKALDLRMQSLGSKTSIYTQPNMPPSHRRGIKAKTEVKDEKRRREAKENGIVLEKPTHKPKTSDKQRERGVGGPSVGKFTGGTLNLSKRDLSVIQGGTSRGKPKRGRR